MRYLPILLICLLFSPALFAKEITFGVVPQQSPFKLLKVWKPVIDHIEKVTGEKIVLKIERSIPEFERVLYEGGYDFAYMNPYHYVLAHEKQGFTAGLRADKNIVGIMVVHKESMITDVSMTKGKQFLFPAPYSFAATLLVKYELLQKFGINVEADNTIRYVNSHDSVYKGVARGVGDVGGGIERTFKNFGDKRSKDSLVILHRTHTYPSHPFAFSSSVDEQTRAKITKAMLEMPDALLNALSMQRIIKTDDAEYGVIRDIARKLSLTKE